MPVTNEYIAGSPSAVTAAPHPGQAMPGQLGHHVGERGGMPGGGGQVRTPAKGPVQVFTLVGLQVVGLVADPPHHLTDLRRDGCRWRGDAGGRNGCR